MNWIEEKLVNKEDLKRGAEISKRDLRKCYWRLGIVAGFQHFDDYWARDSLFASWGSLAIGDNKKVKDNLSLFLKYQKPNGLIPRRIDRYHFTKLIKYAASKRIPRKKPKPIYIGRHFSPNVDPNSLIIITAEKYFEKTKDKKWLKNNFHCLIKAAEWLISQDKDKDDLIEEGLLANWMDTIRKFFFGGKTLYSNVLAWKALDSLNNLSKKLKTVVPEKLVKKKLKLEKDIQKRFWNGKYFSDYIYDGKRHDYFDTAGNMFAIVFGLASKDQSRKILAHREKCFKNEILPRTNCPAYPTHYTAIQQWLFGYPGYQNFFGVWLWMAALEALAYKKVGKKKQANEKLQEISKWISRHGAVYEVYTPYGEPYHGKFLKSETPFAWNAGLFLWAVKEMN